MRRAVGGAARVLRERPEVRVVVDVDGYAESAGQLVAGREVAPAAEDSGADSCGPPIEWRRHAHADPVHVGQVEPGSPDESSYGVGGPVQRVLPVLVDVDRLGVLDERGPVRSATATRRCRWPRSTPTTAPVPGLSVTSTGGRPLPPLCG